MTSVAADAEATMQCSSSDVQFEIVDGRPSVRGECDLANAARIEEWVGSLDSDPLEIDLSGVTFFGCRRSARRFECASTQPANPLSQTEQGRVAGV
jgi:hypothetical protein